MSTPLLIGITIAYAGIAASEVFKGNYPMAAVFGGYTFANVGLIAAMWQS